MPIHTDWCNSRSESNDPNASQGDESVFGGICYFDCSTDSNTKERDDDNADRAKQQWSTTDFIRCIERDDDEDHEQQAVREESISCGVH
jgi:hypothetical protein